jgi:hypothetical protein
VTNGSLVWFQRPPPRARLQGARGGRRGLRRKVAPLTSRIVLGESFLEGLLRLGARAARGPQG